MSLNHLLNRTDQIGIYLNPLFNSVKIINDLEVENIICNGNLTVDGNIIGPTGASASFENINVDEINNYTSGSDVKIQNGLSFSDDSKTLKNNNIINIRSDNGVSSQINFITNGSNRLQLTPSLVTSLSPFQANSGISILAGEVLTIGSGQALMTNNSLRIIAGNSDMLRISTLNASSTNWISASFGIEFTSVPVSRIVLGNLLGKSTMGGHIWDGSNYISWTDLYLNDAGNVHINAPAYESANSLSVGGFIDCLSGFKQNNNKLIENNNVNTIIYAPNNNIFLCPILDAGTYVLETTTSSKYFFISPLANLNNNNYIGLSGQSPNINFCQILLPFNCNIKSIGAKLNNSPTGSRSFTLFLNSSSTGNILTISGTDISGKLENINLICNEFDFITINHTSLGASNSSGSIYIEYVLL